MSERPRILNYATPGAYGRLRLPSDRWLEVEICPDGVEVSEGLAVKGGAIAAVVFAAAVLPWLGFVIVMTNELEIWLSIGGLWMVQFVVMLLVIHQTWRVTVLSVRNGQVRVRSIGPLGRREKSWPAKRIRRLRLIKTGESIEFGPLGKLEIEPEGSAVIGVFAGHRRKDLLSVLRPLHAALKPPSAAVARKDNALG